VYNNLLTKYAIKIFAKITNPLLNSLKVIFLPVYKFEDIYSISTAKTSTNIIKDSIDTKRKYTQDSLLKGPKI
jgi:hypothetical protein